MRRAVSSSSLLALACLLTGLLALVPSAAAGERLPAGVDRSGPTRVHRAYGERAVRTVPGRSYVVVFRGRAGDLVRMAPKGPGGQHWWLEPGRSRLVGPGGGRLRANALGFSRLRVNGVHRFRFTAASRRTQLVKLAAVRARPGGRVARPAARGIQRAVDVRVPRSGARFVEWDWCDRGALAGRALPWPDDLDVALSCDVTLVPGAPLLLDELEWSPSPARPGQRLRLLQSVGERLRVRAEDLPVVSPEVDGAAVPLPTSGAGAVLTIEPGQATSAPSGLLALRQPSAWSYVVAVAAGGMVETGAGLIRPSTTSTTTVLLFPVPFLRRDDDAVALGSLARHPEQVVRDGPAVRVPVDPAGRGVLVPVTPDPVDEVRGARLVVSDAPSGDWLAEAGVLVHRPYPRSCNGCGEQDKVSLDAPGVSEGVFLTRGRDAWILLTPAAGPRSGEFEVAVESSAE